MVTLDKYVAPADRFFKNKPSAHLNIKTFFLISSVVVELIIW